MGLTPLQRCSRFILQPQPTGPGDLGYLFIAPRSTMTLLGSHQLIKHLFQNYSYKIRPCANVIQLGWWIIIIVIVFELVKLATLVEDDPKAPFSITTTTRGECYFIVRILFTLALIHNLYCWVLSKEVSITIFWVFGMTRPGIEPRSPWPLANTLLIKPIGTLMVSVFYRWGQTVECCTCFCMMVTDYWVWQIALRFAYFSILNPGELI